MNYLSIIKEPIITEKSVLHKESGNKYLFRISRTATKGQVKKTIEDLYGVTVVSVNTLFSRGKLKRSVVSRKHIYRKSDVKKALVTLKDGDTLKFLEGGKNDKKS